MFSKTKADKNTKIGLGVGVIIKDADEKILLEKRKDNGMWGLPGGKIEAGESIIEGAIREVKEETGLSVNITRLLGVYSKPSDGRIITYLDNGDVVHLIDILLEGEIISGELTISNESEELIFFHHHDLPSEIAPPAKEPLTDYINNISGIIK